VMIWRVPDGGVTSQISDPVQVLSGHTRKVGTATFNPVAAHLLATSSFDYSVRLWDMEKGTNLITAGGHTDLILSVAWNYNGALVATTCKDKRVRLFDPRTPSIVQEVICHQGAKGSRVCWLKDKVLTAGFSKYSEREVAIFDTRSIGEPLLHHSVDTSSGMLMPFFDPESSLLFLPGKGDGNIRLYEITDEAPYLHHLSEYRSPLPQKGLAFMPKRALDTSACEIARALKLGTQRVDSISFRLPHNPDLFEEDFYPDTYAGVPSISLEDWMAGENAEPTLISFAYFTSGQNSVIDFNPITPENPAPVSQDDVEKVAYLESKLIK